MVTLLTIDSAMSRLLQALHTIYGMKNASQSHQILGMATERTRRSVHILTPLVYHEMEKEDAWRTRKRSILDGTRSLFDSNLSDRPARLPRQRLTVEWYGTQEAENKQKIKRKLPGSQDKEYSFEKKDHLNLTRVPCYIGLTVLAGRKHKNSEIKNVHYM